MADCINKVPWLYGKPDNVIYLDDEQALNRNRIQLDNGPRSDYYVHFNDCRWIIVERKDQGHSRIERAITQIRNTVRQLRSQGHSVNKVILVAEKLGKPEDGVYGISPDDSHEVYSRTSPNRKRILIEGINLLFYSIRDVDSMRGRGGAS